MSRRIALVRCTDCAATGLAPGGLLQCGWCLGQRHIAVDRTSDGGIPDGYSEWVDHELPSLPPNPLRLTDAPTQANER